jgi:REP element-mobilizing transposase RayT
MAQALRVEDPETVSFLTTRTRNSELWSVQNEKLHKKVCGYLAKYQEKYGVVIYSFVVMGNHIHLNASFPLANRASFMRDFNSIVVRLTKRHVPEYPGGSLWGRRYAEQALPEWGDVEKYFFY